MNKASERYNVKVEIPISAILETIFSSDNKDVETLCRWAKKYGFVNLEDGYYKLQDDYTKQNFYIILSKEERKQYDYENYLIDETDKYKNKINEAIECISNFLCTEEYINIDGKAIANNYEKILEILNLDKIEEYVGENNESKK